jgi:endo-1,4-beta-xylanase
MRNFSPNRRFPRVSALFVLLGSALVAGCASPTSTPLATILAPVIPTPQIAEITPTARAVTATPVPTDTPTITPLPTDTSPPTDTPLPTNTATPRPPTLRDLADKAETEFGVSYSAPEPGPRNLYQAAVAENFNSITIEGPVSWSWMHRNVGGYDFGLADRVVKFAKDNKIQVRGHPLVWEGDLFPSWLTGGSYTPDQLRSIMTDHIRTVVSRYRGSITEWVVVNEAVWWFKGSTGYSSKVFYPALGKDYISTAFQTAREADPEALLIYNDFGNETPGPKSDLIFDLVSQLKAKNLVDAIGMQFHVGAPPLLPPENPNPNNFPSKATLIAQMKRYGNIGVKVIVTELDVDISGIPGTLDQRLTRQAEIYKTVTEACLESGVCSGITLWGLNDEESWLLKLGGQSPLLFSQYQPKPAYYAVRDALLGK